MAQNNLNETTRQVLKDLQDDLSIMLIMKSNIDVIWRLEDLQNNKALQKSADLIRKSINN